MARPIPAGQASFTLTLNDKLSEKLKGVGQRMKATVGRIGSTAVMAAKAATKAFAAIGAGLAALGASAVAIGRKFADFGDKFDKMAIRTDIGREALQELGYAAELSGTNIDQLSQAMFRARRRLGNMALAGGGPAARALQSLGINAEELSKQSPETVFYELVKALGKVENEAKRNQLAFEIFGDNFRQIQPLIDAGVDGIDAMRQEARDMGLVLSDEDVRNAAKLTDAFTRIGRVIEIIAIKIGAALGPTLATVFDKIAVKLGQLVKWIEEAAGGLNVLAAQIELAFAEAIQGIVRQFKNAPGILGAILGGAGAGVDKWAGLDDWVTAARKRLTDAMRGAARDTSDTTGLGAASAVAEQISLNTTQTMGGFGPALSRLAFGKTDPKKEEKQMVSLLEEIADSDGLVVGA